MQQLQKHLKMSTQLSIKRPKSCRPMDVRLLNHKEDVHLQWKLHNIRAKYRLNLRLLEQERELVLKEHKRLLNLRVCEPRATINNTMRAISEVRMTNDANETRFSKSAPAFRPLSSVKTYEDDKEQRFAKSASFSVKQDDSSPPMIVTEKFKSSENGQLSILQLKDLALIDSISQKELMYREEYYRWYKERLKQLQREKLQQKIRSFLNSIEHLTMYA
ncbi:uncharacterized protein LOC131523084 [Onychostoma macrolepis]|uniref:Uncharacterized protein n=1 Tax=Onychostoma macrolepis TaxID=369639 RepID=A0A7J6C4J7_9TELE|nr:uncharacterized protein LOC131523084 [Onychostoma macrolepis]KAF4101914.1 hypothetical protein G5714_016714 [Onychostoma macrolepis]